MTHEKHGSTLLCDLSNFPQTFFLKLHVAHRQHFVDQQNLRLKMSRDRKGKADVHPAGVTLHRRVYELFDLSKRHDFVELSIDLCFLHAQNNSVQVDVLPPGQLGVKTRADFQQRTHAAANVSKASGWLGDARKYF